ncbi:MAG: hypothetical protein H5T47_02425 [Archaeoglobi archaeon]|nr:hypothetical protein [Candidatus Mnemosynella bozhongmuii]
MTLRRAAFLMSLAVILLLITQPALGAVSGGPEFEVMLAGQTEFPANETVNVVLLIVNEGKVNWASSASPEILEILANQSAWAYDVFAQMKSTDEIAVRSEKQFVGTIPNGYARTVTFEISIKDVPEGEYLVPLELEYRELEDVYPVFSGAQIEYHYVWAERTETIYVPIKVVREFQPEVLSVESSSTVPGGIAEIQLIVRNNGTSEVHDVEFQIVPSTFITPLNTQFVERISPGDVFNLSFRVLISENAAPSEVQMMLKYSYKDELNKKKEGFKTFNLRILDKPDISVEILSSRLVAGAEGSLELKLKNQGDVVMKNIIVAVTPSPPITTSDTRYIESLSPGEEIQISFKLSVLSSAKEGTYPLNLIISYEDEDGNAKAPVRETIGVPVKSKPEFSVVKVVSELKPGRTSVIEVHYRNDGDETVYNAVARLSIVDPFSSSDDSAYLGTIEPGEVKVAKFRIDVDDDAIPKEYVLNSQIKYENSEGDTVISETIKVPLKVEERTQNPLGVVLLIVAVVIAAGAYYLWRRR